jgi:hypothetical protein
MEMCRLHHFLPHPHVKVARLARGRAIGAGVGPDASISLTKKDKQAKVMIIFISQAPKDLTVH